MPIFHRKIEHKNLKNPLHDFTDDYPIQEKFLASMISVPKMTLVATQYTTGKSVACYVIKRRMICYYAKGDGNNCNIFLHPKKWRVERLVLGANRLKRSLQHIFGVVLPFVLSRN